MLRHTRSRISVLILGLAMLSPGCGEDNQKVSQVDGPAAADSLSPEERYKQTSSSSSNILKQGYNGKTTRRAR